MVKTPTQTFRIFNLQNETCRIEIKHQHTRILEQPCLKMAAPSYLRWPQLFIQGGVARKKKGHIVLKTIRGQPLFKDGHAQISKMAATQFSRWRGSESKKKKKNGVKRKIIKNIEVLKSVMRDPWPSTRHGRVTVSVN